MSAPGPSVFVFTGAYDCGKSTTLAWLREHHGRRIHTEAHRLVLRAIAGRSHGHPPDRGFTPVTDPDHFCPMCQPRAFAELVLAEQRRLEAQAQTGDLLERGYLDPIEMLGRTDLHAPRPAWTPVARYRRVFSFAVMPELQRPRWGKSRATRIAEARAINLRLEGLYRDAGFEVIEVGPGTVAERGTRVLDDLDA